MLCLAERTLVPDGTQDEWSARQSLKNGTWQRYESSATSGSVGLWKWYCLARADGEFG